MDEAQRSTILLMQSPSIVPIIPEAVPLVATTTSIQPTPINPHTSLAAASVDVALAAAAAAVESPLSGLLVPIVSAVQQSTPQINPIPVRLSSSYKELESGKRMHHDKPCTDCFLTRFQFRNLWSRL